MTDRRRLSLRSWVWLLGVFAVACLALNQPSHAVSVCSVHDGDTFHLCYGPVIRLWGIDAPELNQPYGPEARQALENLVSQKNVNLTCADSSYKRWVCLVEVNGQNINYEMVKKGMAYAEPHYSSTTFKQVEAQAKSQQQGVWAQTSGGEKPWEYRHRIKQAEKEQYPANAMNTDNTKAINR